MVTDLVCTGNTHHGTNSKTRLFRFGRDLDNVANLHAV